MSVLPKLSSSQGRRDEEPNKELGRNLAETMDLDGIQEVGKNLGNENRSIQIDCLAVMEQIGHLAPELIEEYLEDFLRLAFGKDNRLVWAAMINIALIADRKPDQILERIEELIDVIEKGSVITRDNGIKILSRAGAANQEYNQLVFPFLIDQLKLCRPKSLPQYAESVFIAVNPANQDQYLTILNKRLDELSPAQSKRVKKIIRSFS
jgi:hypothetical protein